MRRLLLLFALLLATPASAAADHHQGGRGDRVTRVSAYREILTAREELRGAVRVRTPGTWAHRNRDGARTASFLARSTSGCEARVSVSVRGKATRRGPVTQARDATGSAPALGEGTSSRGAWRLARIAERELYGIAPLRVQRRRYAQARVFATYGAGCSEAEITEGPVVVALRRLLTGVRQQTHVVRARR